MNVRVNGHPQQVQEDLTLQQLLTDLGYRDQLVAVAVNRSCVRRADLGATLVRPGDEVEILAPMAGG